MNPARIRRLVFAEAAVAAAVINNAAYNVAVAANKAQGRLLELADGRARVARNAG